MNAFPSLPEKHEALQRLAAASALPVDPGAEIDLEIARQAAALRALAACDFVATFVSAFRQGWAAAAAGRTVAGA